MKRLATILFLAILAFNFYGYQLLISCVEKNNDVVLEGRLDNHEYNDDNLISIKTPLNLPYSTNSISYERAYGSVNVNGVDYEYVKRRVYHDTLELLCVPNTAKTNLRDTRNDFVKLSLEAQPTGKKSTGHSNLKIGLPDYFQDINPYKISKFCVQPKRLIVANTYFLPNDYTNQPDRPPQLMQSIS